jgi:uncharacterized protein YciI
VERTSAAPQGHALLTYDYVPNFGDLRTPHRAGHLELIRAWKHEGRMVLAGAMADPARALFVLCDQAGAHDFMDADPYARNGLVRQWKVENLVVV